MVLVSLRGIMHRYGAHGPSGSWYSYRRKSARTSC